MGAHDFQCTARGKNAADAYRNAVDDAIAMYGQDPYNGTISTTSGFIMIHVKERGQELTDLLDDALMNDTYRGIKKWENCGCINLGDGIFKFFGWAAS